MRGLSMVGVTHRRAGLGLLERVALAPDDQQRLVAAAARAGWGGAVALSTCSRTELYAHAAPDGTSEVLSLLSDTVGAAPAEVEAAAEIRTGQAVVEHLFRLVAGLESRVAGEVDVHGQVRKAFREAAGSGAAGPALGRLFPAALRSSTRVRNQTCLGEWGRSLGRRAVDVGLANCPGRDPVVLVVGSGRMASAAVGRLAETGRRPLVAARDELAAARLVGALRSLPLSTLGNAVCHADLVICATSATAHVVTRQQVAEALALRPRPLTVVDLSVPRNVEPGVAALPGVHLVDLEQLGDDPESDADLAAALATGRALATADARAYAAELAAHAAGPVIAAIRLRVEQTCRVELARAGRGTGGTLDVDRLAHAVAGKLLHHPTLAARGAAATGRPDVLTLLCEVFGVAEPGEVGDAVTS